MEGSNRRTMCSSDAPSLCKLDETIAARQSAIAADDDCNTASQQRQPTDACLLASVLQAASLNGSLEAAASDL